MYENRNKEFVIIPEEEDKCPWQEKNESEIFGLI